MVSTRRGNSQVPGIVLTDREEAGVAVVLLVFHGWFAGRASRLRGRQLLVITSVAAGLGLVMILTRFLGGDERQYRPGERARTPPAGPRTAFRLR